VCEATNAWIETGLKNQEPQWALSRNGGSWFCTMTTNASESFNNVLKGARSLSIQALIIRTFFCLVNCFGYVGKMQRDMTHCWHRKIRTFWGIASIRHDFIQYKDLVKPNERCQSREGYMCIVNLMEDGPTRFYNLPQLQKLP